MIMSTTNARLSERRKQARRDARLVLDTTDADFGLVAVVGDSGNHEPLHDILLARHPGALDVGKRGAHVDRDPILFRELHRSDLKYFRTETRHLEHLVEGDATELACRGDQVGIRRVHAVDVGVDLAHIGAEGGRHGDRRGVRAAATERGDVALIVDALESQRSPPPYRARGPRGFVRYRCSGSWPGCMRRPCACRSGRR